MVGSPARLLDHGGLSKPLSLVKDGDIIAIVQHMILARGAGNCSGARSSASGAQTWEY